MRHDVKPIRLDLRLPRRVMGQEQRLPLFATANRMAEPGRQVGQPGHTSGPDHRPPVRGIAHHQIAPGSPKRRSQRQTGALRRDQGRQAVADHLIAGGRPVPLPRHHLPVGLALPQRRSTLTPCLCQRQGRRTGQQALQPTGGGIAGGQATGRRDRRPKAGTHGQGVELERLFGVPLFGNMRGQRPDRPAAGPGTDRQPLNQPHLGAAPRAVPADGQTEHPAAAYRHIHRRVPCSAAAPARGRRDDRP